MINAKDILNKIGISGQETRVYLALLKFKESQSGNLCSETGIPSSNIYRILGKLMEKGLVSYRIQNNTKIFMPSPPETLNEIFLEKQKNLEKERKDIQELIANLKTKKIQEPQSNYKYYEGISGIKGMWHEINSDMKKGDSEIIYAGEKESYEALLGFYNEHHKQRLKKKIKAKLLFPIEEKKLAKKRKKELADVKFAKLENKAEWGIIGDMLFIQYIISKKPVGFLIKNKIISDTFKQAFEQIWKKT